MNKDRMKAIAMLIGWVKSPLSPKNWLVHITMLCLWHHTCSACATGLMISAETNSWENDRGQQPKYLLDDVNMVVKCIPLKKCMTQCNSYHS